MVGNLYPFGFGLSYTTFDYKNLIVDLEQVHEGKINISVDITNTGDLKGDEIVQLYMRDLVSSVITYDSQLRGFERVSLNPRETKTLHFTLKPHDLQLLNKDMNWVVEPGMFEVLIGASSKDIKIREQIEITEFK